MGKRYDEYLASKHWQRTRLRKLLAAELDNTFNVIRCQVPRCRMWFPMGFIHVHHKTYKRIGRERMSDLQVLCVGCHGYRHDRPRPLWWLELKKRNARCITRHTMYRLRNTRHISEVVVECIKRLEPTPT